MFRKNNDWIVYGRCSVLYQYQMFQKSIPLLDSFDSAINYDLNQVIELANIVKITQSIECPTNLSPAKFNEYKVKTDEISRFVCSYFNALNLDNLELLFQSVEYIYSLCMLELLEKFELIKKISEDCVRDLLDKKIVSLFDILRCKGWVKRFNQVITDCMKDNKEAAEIIIKYHLTEKFSKQENITFPCTLTEERKINILGYYVEQYSSPHPNYLELIENAPVLSDFHIDDKLRLKAKRKKEKFWEKHFSENPPAHVGCSAGFIEMDEDKNEYYDEKERCQCCFYSKEWVREHHDFPTLLNNFIFLLDFFDLELRCQFVLKRNRLIDELLPPSDGKKHYPINTPFGTNRMVCYAIMSAYMNELADYGICIEDLLENFFNVYLKENFGISDFRFNKPSTTSMLERNKLLCSEIDSVLKQMKCYIEEDCVDRELIAISSKPVNVGEMKSFQEQKYAYLKGKDLQDEMRFLFSYDLMFGMDYEWGGCESLVQLIASKRITLEHFAKPAREWVNWLVNRGSLFFKADESLGLNVTRYRLLRNLYENDVLCFAHRTEDEKDVLAKLLDDGEIDVEATLLSRQERDYFNFMLNKKEFSNGFDLRNKFIHGTFYGTAEELQKAYVEILKILVMIVVKINEEFCLKFPEENQLERNEI